MLLPQNLNRALKKKARKMPGCGGYLIIWAGGVGGQTTGLTDQPRVQACWQMSVWGDSPTPQHQGNQFIVSLNRSLLFIKIHYVMYSHLPQFLWPRKSTDDNSRWSFACTTIFLPLVAKAPLKQQSQGWFGDTVLLRLLLQWGSGSLLHSASLQGLSNNILCFGFFFFLILWKMGQW